MKDEAKVYPIVEVEIGGDIVSVSCDYRTIYNYEVATGKTLATIFQNPVELSRIATIVDFLSAAISHKDRKYSKQWILDNMTPEIVRKMSGEAILYAIKAAFVDEDSAEKEKKTEKEPGQLKKVAG